MTRKLPIVLAAVLLWGAAAWAQQDTTQTPQEPPRTPPVPAFGEGPPPQQITQAPPVTSLDEASLEPAIAARSFLQPGVHVVESVNSDLGTNGVVGITRVLGSLDLLRLWSRYSFSLDYVGGLSLYSDQAGQPSQVHMMDASQRYSWRTGQIQVRDDLTYLPEGSFGFSGFGGAGGGSGGGLGTTNSFGSLGVDPRLTNGVSVDIRESLTPRSSVTAAGGYTFTHFLNSSTPGNTGTIDSTQVSAQAGYSHVLNRTDQLGLQYGYQQFQFPTQGAGTIDSHTFQGIYEHQITGRMDLILGAGPQITTIMVPATTILNPNPPPPDDPRPSQLDDADFSKCAVQPALPSAASFDLVELRPAHDGWFRHSVGIAKRHSAIYLRTAFEPVVERHGRCGIFAAQRAAIAKRQCVGWRVPVWIWGRGRKPPPGAFFQPAASLSIRLRVFQRTFLSGGADLFELDQRTHAEPPNWGHHLELASGADQVGLSLD